MRKTVIEEYRVPANRFTNFYHFNELTSTMDKCEELIQRGVSRGIVLADSQREGYGRNSKKWVSPNNGNIYLSFFEKMNPLKPVNFVAQRCALASFWTVESFVTAQFLKIKWPNDILIEMKKVSGCIGKRVEYGKNSFFVCGIGVNLFLPQVSSTKFVWPPASISEKFPEVKKGKVLEELIKQTESAFALDDSSLIELYSEKISWMIGKEVLFSQDLIKKEKGLILGFDNDCSALTLKTEDGVKELSALSLLALRGSSKTSEIS